jgi:Lysylphosphatidylglycerol synthase TM region
MLEWVEFAWRGGRHALELVAHDVATVSPVWLAAGAALHVLHQVVRTRAWFNIIRAACPDARRLRGRDVTAAYLAGAGLNGAVPARGGDVVKLYLIRRREPDLPWSTLISTFVPETLFETAIGIGLVTWALTQGFLPVPLRPKEIPSVDVSLFIDHPFAMSVATVATLATGLLLARALRRRARGMLANLRRGLAILERPGDFVRGVVGWQALARVIRVASLACFLAAFALPVTVGTAILVMAAQGGGRIVPFAPVSAGLRTAMLTYGFVEVTGEAVDLAQLVAFSFGVSAIVFVVGFSISLAILARELSTASPRLMIDRMRLATHPADGSPVAAPGPPAAPGRAAGG